MVAEATAEDNGLTVLALSAAVFATDLARQVHGPDAQLEMDGRAMDSMFYEERELRRMAGSDE